VETAPTRIEKLLTIRRNFLQSSSHST